MGEMEMERRNNYRFSLLSINCSNWTFGHFVVDDDLWLQLCNLFASQEGQGETGGGDFYIHLPGDLVLPVLFISSLIYCCLMERDERLNNPASDTGAIRWWWGSFCNNSLISRNLLIFLCNRHPGWTAGSVASECVLWAYLFSNAAASMMLPRIVDKYEVVPARTTNSKMGSFCSRFGMRVIIISLEM